MNRQKTLIIGIDGICWEYLNPLLQTNKLPNLSKIITKGSKGIARSTLPPISAVAWSSFMTGKDPVNHGILDWCTKNPKNNTFRPVYASDRRGKAFWRYLTENGYQVGVYNLPLTYPPEEGTRFFFSGFDSPANLNKRVRPQELFEPLLQKYGAGFLQIPDKNLPMQDSGQRQFINLYIEHINKQTLVALELMEKYDLDVLVINFMILDHTSHRLKDFSLVEEGIMAVDKNLGKFLERYPGANYILFSDHGSIRINKILFIYNWLEQIGLIELNEEKRQEEKIHAIIKELLKTKLKIGGNAEKIARNLIIKTLRLLPEQKYNNAVKQLSQKVPYALYDLNDIINLKNSKVQYVSIGCQGFYLNVRSPENPEGVIKSKQEYQEVLDYLSEELQKLRLPDSDRLIFDRLVKKQELPEGPYKYRAPDLIAHSAKLPIYFTTLSFVHNDDSVKDSMFYDSEVLRYYGGHTDNGICVFAGKDFNRGLEVEIDLKDVPAIILYLLKVPIPDDFDGKVNTSIFKQNFLNNNPILNQHAKVDELKESTISEEEEEMIKQRLVDLGYM